jgi:hypothetical protein
VNRSQPKSGMCVSLTNIMTYVKSVLKFSLVSQGLRVEKRTFPYKKPPAHITLACATVLACDICICVNTYVCIVHE